MNLEIFQKLKEGEDLMSIAEYYDLTHDEVKELRGGLTIYIVRRAELLKKAKYKTFSLICDLIKFGEECPTYVERKPYWNAIEDLYLLRIFLEKEQKRLETEGQGENEK